MTDFSHLKQYNADESETKEYPLTELSGDYVLIVKQANESNKPYMSEVLRQSGGGRGQRKKKIKIDGKYLEKIREMDKEIYPKFVITGWKGVVDSDGKEVKYSEKKCAEFLQALPDWIFNPLREFCVAPENFLSAVIDSEELGKN